MGFIGVYFLALYNAAMDIDFSPGPSFLRSLAVVLDTVNMLIK
jgi:hypothetical protein